MKDLNRKDIRLYTKGENVYLDPLINDDEVVITINWFNGRVPVAVPLAVSNKEAWAEQRYRELYE